MRATFLLLLPFVIASCNSEKKHTDLPAGAVKNSLRIKGSETMLPLMNAELGGYNTRYPSPGLKYDATGSNVAILSFQREEADLVALSRKPTEEEMKMLQRNGEVVLVPIGYDGIDIIINRSNRIDRLTMEQLRGIYSGKITSWSEVGGERMPVKVFSRDVNSGTYDFFRQHVLDSLNYRADDINSSSNEAIVQGVKDNPGAIGYVGMGFGNSDTKSLTLSADEGTSWYDNRHQNIRNQHYPLTRTLYVAYYRKNEQKVKAVIDFIRSTEGQALVEKSGYVSLNTL